MTIHIGFTGTQRGLADVQVERIAELVRHKDHYAHHGDCIGADAQFDAIVRDLPTCRGVIVHPPLIPDKRAFVKIHVQDVLRPEKEYLERNRDIVLEVKIRGGFLIVGPGEAQMQQRSGTWSTYRYARSLGVHTALVLPNGAVIYETT